MTAQNSPVAARSHDYDFAIHSRWGLKGRMISNTGLLGGARLLSAVMGIATLVITARALDDTMLFGALLFIHAYMLFFSEVASVKSWQALIRFGADEVKAKNAPRFAALVKTSLVGDILAAVIAFLMAISLFNLFTWLQSVSGLSLGPQITELPTDISLQKMAMIYCTVILFRQVNTAIGVFRLFDKFTILAARALVMPTIRLIGAFIGEAQGWGLVEFLAVWYGSSLMGYLVLHIFGAREILKRRFGPALRGARLCRPSEFNGLYPFVVKTNIDASLRAFKSKFPSLGVTFVFGPAAFAIYYIAEEISRLLTKAITLFDQVLFPELSRMAVDLDLKMLFKTAARSAMGIGIAGFALAGLMMVYGQAIVTSAFDSSFEQTPALAVMLLIATSLAGIATPFYSAFYVMMRPGSAIAVRLIGVAAFIGLFFWLSRSMGLFSIGWAAIAGAVIEVVLVVIFTIWLIRKRKRDMPSKINKSKAI